MRLSNYTVNFSLPLTGKNENTCQTKKTINNHVVNSYINPRFRKEDLIYFTSSVNLKPANSYFVTGHDNPDADSVCSAIALAYLERKLTKKSVKPVCVNMFNDETKYILDRFKVSEPEIMSDFRPYPRSKIILVDNNELGQYKNRINISKIAAIVDHHELNCTGISPEYICKEKVGATATIVADMYDHYKIKMPKKVANILLSAIISDTNMLKSSTTTEKDRIIVNKLLEVAYVDINELGSKILEAKTTKHKEMPIKDIYQGQKRSYMINDFPLHISSIQVSSMDDFLDTKKAEMLEYMNSLEQEEKDGKNLLIIKDINDKKTCILFTDNAKDLITGSFKKTDCVVKNKAVLFDGLLSRKDVVENIRQTVG